MTADSEPQLHDLKAGGLSARRISTRSRFQQDTIDPRKCAVGDNVEPERFA
jgi:hypothetical protein